MSFFDWISQAANYSPSDPSAGLDQFNTPSGMSQSVARAVMAPQASMPVVQQASMPVVQQASMPPIQIKNGQVGGGGGTGGFNWDVLGAGLKDLGMNMQGRQGNNLSQVQYLNQQRKKLEEERKKQQQKLREQQAKAYAQAQLAEQNPEYAAWIQAGYGKDVFSQINPTQTSMMKNLQAAGYQPGTPGYQSAMMQAVLKPQVQIGNGGPKLPAGYMWQNPNAPTQGVQPIPGGPATMPTQSEREAAAFAQQQQSAGSRIEELENQGIDSMSTWDHTVSGIPMLGNFMVSEGGQQYRQASIDWAMTNLRDESGAAITASEAETQMQRFFPMPGDTPGAVEQKRKSRRAAERAAATRAGRAIPGVEGENPAPDILQMDEEDGVTQWTMKDTEDEANRKFGATPSGGAKSFRYDPAKGILIPR